MLRRTLQARVRPALRIFPAVSVLSISAIIACIVAINQKTILTVPLMVLAAVILHNALGFLCGFWAARGTGAAFVTARTISIEVGMQNSGLAVALAGTFFGALPISLLVIRLSRK